ncbi:MAG TPA: ferritin-like domain-containing protein [Alcaligenaceae bacterium]|nr:ferritin-like domain-containing protein [Alcaligenaceae bacterium]
MDYHYLREHALHALLLSDPKQKADYVKHMVHNGPFLVGADVVLTESPAIPGRPSKPDIVPPQQVKQRSLHNVTGRATLLHALAHIEFNAINLALDIIWRYADMPDAFYGDWLCVAYEEVLHFELLNQRLKAMGYSYGDFPAHDGLWDMAERTKDDLVARLALVPRTLEARGLDACPVVRAKLAQAGDEEAAAILDIILRDEVGHVALGNKWYRWLCDQKDLDAILIYPDLATEYRAPRLRGPFNIPARQAAGFLPEELAYLQKQAN